VNFSTGDPRRTRADLETGPSTCRSISRRPTPKSPSVSSSSRLRTGRQSDARRLEAVVASLEVAQFAVAFSSGLSATDAMLRTLAPGDRVMLSADAYGGTYRMLTKIFGPWGIETDVVDLSDISAVESAWGEGTKLVWAETPSNPGCDR